MNERHPHSCIIHFHLLLLPLPHPTFGAWRGLSNTLIVAPVTHASFSLYAIGIVQVSVLNNGCASSIRSQTEAIVEIRRDALRADRLDSFVFSFLSFPCAPFSRSSCSYTILVCWSARVWASPVRCATLPLGSCVLEEMRAVCLGTTDRRPVVV